MEQTQANEPYTADSQAMMFPVEQITPVGGRKALGDVPALSASIEAVGLLHPVVLNSRFELIAGRRRLEAVKMLGWKTVPARVVESLDDALLAIRAERDENSFREPLTATELVEIGKQLEALEKPKAKERQAKAGPKTGKGKKTGSGKLPEPVTGDTRDKVGSALGYSGRTFEKAKQVVEAAQSEPEKFGDLPAMMDRESVDAAHKELKHRQQPKSPEKQTIFAEKRTVERNLLTGKERFVQEETTRKLQSDEAETAEPQKKPSPELQRRGEDLGKAIDDLFKKMNHLWDAIADTSKEKRDEKNRDQIIRNAKHAMRQVGRASDRLLALVISDWMPKQFDARTARAQNIVENDSPELPDDVAAWLRSAKNRRRLQELLIDRETA